MVMYKEGLAQKNQQGPVPPRIALPTGVDQSFGTSVPGASQPGVENGFHVQSGAISLNTYPSSSIPFLNPLAESRGFSDGTVVMPHRLSNSAGPTEHPQRSAAMLAQPHPDSTRNSALRRRSQTTPSFLRSGLVTHGQEPQTTLGNPGQSASLAQRTSQTSFLGHPLPARFSPEHSHTPYNSFPEPYVMPTYPSLLHGQPSQPQVYRGYHLPGPSPYAPAHYYPLPPHEPQQYFQPAASMHGRSPSYQQAGHLPLPTPQFVSGGGLGSSHAGPYGGMQQYAPAIYGPSDHFGLVQQYQPEMGRWHYGLNPPADPVVEGDAMQSYPYPLCQPRTELPYRDRIQTTDSRHIPPPHLLTEPNGDSASAITSRNTTSVATRDSLEQTSVQSSQETDTYPLSQKSGHSTSRAPVRPFVRRHYHPNPPPNQSEWVMWVGNVPNDATQEELSQFLRKPIPGSSVSVSEENNADDGGLVSVFLISRSNCAFANYQSEESLKRAISRFNGLKLRPQDRRCPRLVCRARRQEDNLQAGVGAQRGMGVHTHYVKNQQRESSRAGDKVMSSKDRSSVQAEPASSQETGGNDEATRADVVDPGIQKVVIRSPSSYASTSSSFLARHFPIRFFILKSLTRYDLDLSIDRGAWATQKHNEAILDQAFRTSREVILIFSVNKSGEFYGYARMASGISRGNHSISWAARGDSSPDASSPSTSRVAIHDAPEQQGSSSPPSAEMQISPSERHETSRPSLIPSFKEMDGCPTGIGCPELGSDQDTRLAPLVLDNGPLDPNDDCSSAPAPSSTLRPDTSTHLAPSTQGGGGDDPRPRDPLPPVMEDEHTEDGAEEGGPTSTVITSAMMQGRSAGQERGESWGQTFRINWLCTQRVQFHRTRHLRNPWNHDREIKVSRDGTELEPTVGQKLIDSWMTLASEHASGDGRRATSYAGRRGTKLDPKRGSFGDSKGVKQGPS